MFTTIGSLLGQDKSVTQTDTLSFLQGVISVRNLVSSVGSKTFPLKEEVLKSKDKVLALIDENIWEFFMNALDQPNKGNSSYSSRVSYWFKGVSKSSPAVALVKIDKSPHEVYPVCITNAIIDNGNITVTLMETTLIWTPWGLTNTISVPVTHIMPLFSTYFPNINIHKIVRGLALRVTEDLEKEFESNRERIRTMSAKPTLKDPYGDDLPSRDRWTKDFCVNQTESEKQESNNMKSQVKSALGNFAAVETNSFKLAAGLAAGDATNAVVKAVLRPVITPLVVRAVKPKGFVQNILANSTGKVDESVEAVMASPVMDVLAASILVMLTSSGMVTNEKLVRGSQLASDAAAVKLASLIDFDAIVRAVTEKVGSIVEGLESDEKGV